MRAWGLFYCPPRRLRGQIGVRYGENTTERVRKAQNKALESLDYILETIPAPDFVEIVGHVGGDTITYRVYDDGSMYER